MNLQTIAALAAAAFTATSVNAASCDTTAVGKLLASNDVVKCASDSGYEFTSLKTPSETQMQAMCGNEACLTALAALNALNLGDCTVAGFAVMSELVEPIVTTCGDTTLPTSTGTSSGSGAVEPAVGEPSTDGTEGSGSSLDATVPITSSGSEETTEAPSTGSPASAASVGGSASAGSSGSSGSNSGAALTATSALVGSVVLAAAMMA